jgi:Flp pilus assembly protein TadG
MTTTRSEKIGSLRGVHADKRGAVLVEFLVAFMPLMITFSSFVQLSQIATASLVTNHATIVAGRAAAVISNEHNNTPDAKKGKNQDQIEAAVQAGLGPWAQTMEDVKVEIEDKSSKEDNFGMVKVTVTARYKCSVPFGGMLVCGANGGVHEIVKTAAFPHQGACYEDLEGGGCEGGGKE